MVTKRAGQIECKRVVNWSAVFQLVFQLKIKLDINVINQQFTKRIQITPAHQSKLTKPALCGFCRFWLYRKSHTGLKQAPRQRSVLDIPGCATGILFGAALVLATFHVALVTALSAGILGLPGSGAPFLPGIASFTPLFTLLGRVGG
jgi:hypothetical protein